jgi:hypothetical protein
VKITTDRALYHPYLHLLLPLKNNVNGGTLDIPHKPPLAVSPAFDMEKITLSKYPILVLGF